MSNWIRTLMVGAFLFQIPAFADEVIKTFPGGGAEDVIHMTKPIGADDKPVGAIQMKDECFGADKKVYKKGEKGYEDCLKQRLSRPSKSKPNGSRGVNPMGQPTTPVPGQ